MYIYIYVHIGLRHVSEVALGLAHLDQGFRPVITITITIDMNICINNIIIVIMITITITLNIIISSSVITICPR